MTPVAIPPGLVAVPAVPWMFTQAASSFMELAAELPDGSDFLLIEGGTTIAQKRNWAAGRARGLYDWLLMVDSDMTPPPDVVERLWNTMEQEDAHAASVVYTSSRRPAEPYLGVGGDDRPGPGYDRPCPHCLDEHDGALEVEVAGTGCLMIRTEVFHRLTSPYFVARPSGTRSDYNFCERLQEEGMKLVVDTDLEVGHLGVHPFGLGDAVREHKIREEHPELARREA